MLEQARISAEWAWRESIPLEIKNWGNNIIFQEKKMESYES